MNTILFDGQCGFRENLSTSLARVDLVENITKSLDEDEYTIAVLIDLRKAFDTINYSILLKKKLKFCGIQGLVLSWFESYILGRYQNVHYNDKSSTKLPKMCGVPQGSISGPLLFLLYVNYVASVVSERLQFILLFGDDHDKDLLNAQNRLIRINKLSLHLGKTNYMLFNTNKNYVNIKVFIDKPEVVKARNVKFLGVVIDDTIS